MNMLTRTPLTRRLGFSLIASILLAGCTSNAEPIEREPEPMDVAAAPTASKCAAGQVLTCTCMAGGAGTQRCLDTGVFGECSCRAFEQPPKQVECQPGSRVTCMCPNGGTGNHLCRPDSTFEPCSMCIGGDPAIDVDAG